MTYFYDLIAIDTDIDATLSTTVADVELIIRKISSVANEFDHDLWQRIRFFGATRGWPQGMNPHEHWHGTSLELVPFVGTGFYRDYCLHFEIPAVLRQPWEPRREPIRQFSIAKAEKEIPIRGPEVELVKRVVAVTQGDSPVPLRSLIGEGAPDAFLWPVGWRRRQAYVLGYEASLRARSLTPYQQHEKVVIEGSVEDCAKALPVKNDRADLSVLLNVAWFLDNAATWERKNGAPHDLVKAPVVQLELKRRLFDERIDRCVAQLHHSLNADAQIALDALRSQLLEGRNFGLASVGSIPDWGTHPLCDTEWFLAPDEQDMLMDPPSDDESEIGPNGSRHPAVSDVLG